MAIVNFPANPTIGDQYNENGITYTWNGAAWTANGAENTDARYVQVTGDTMTGNLNVPSLNSGPLAGMRNQLINGDFRIWQRGTTVNLTNSGYTADRWYDAGGTTARSVARDGTVPAGFSYALVSPFTGGTLQQGVELPGAGRAGQFGVGTTWTLSVWCDRDLSTAGNVFYRFRDKVGEVANEVAAAAPAAFTATGETSNGYSRYRLTFTVTGAPAGSNLCLNIGIPGGSAFGSSTQYAGVQLEPGPVATPFETRPMQTELALCQRYYLDFSTGWFAPYWHGYDLNCYRGGMQYLLPSEMRTNPTVTTGGFSWVSDPGVDLIGTYGGTAVAGGTTKRVTCYINATSQPPAGINGQCTFHVYCNAEL
ncbi:hypothetical protein [Synechococcus phage MA10]